MAEKKEKTQPLIPEVKPEELAWGQGVVITARWILVGAGLLLAVWNADSLAELRVQVLVILLLAVANFYLHAQLLMRRRTLSIVVYGASAADLAVITVLVLSSGGFSSDVFIFYFPALLALSVAFPTMLTFLYTGGMLGFYGLIGLASVDANLDNLQILLARLIILGGVAFCGNLYWRIENHRRRAAEETREQLMEQIQKRQARRPARA